MNTKNNKRHQDTMCKIDDALVSLLKKMNLKDISVSEICEQAEINRSTFYASYEDIFAWRDAYTARIEKHLLEQTHANDEFAWIFRYIKDNADTFHTYFKLGGNLTDNDYKTLFFKNGVYAIAKQWFDGGCKETPEQMGEIVNREYAKLFGNNRQ